MRVLQVDENLEKLYTLMVTSRANAIFVFRLIKKSPPGIQRHANETRAAKRTRHCTSKGTAAQVQGRAAALREVFQFSNDFGACLLDVTSLAASSDKLEGKASYDISSALSQASSILPTISATSAIGGGAHRSGSIDEQQKQSSL